MASFHQAVFPTRIPTLVWWPYENRRTKPFSEFVFPGKSVPGVKRVRSVDETFSGKMEATEFGFEAMDKNRRDCGG